jgi:hypothetical protein
VLIADSSAPLLLLEADSAAAAAAAAASAASPPTAARLRFSSFSFCLRFLLCLPVPYHHTTTNKIHHTQTQISKGERVHTGAGRAGLSVSGFRISSKAVAPFLSNTTNAWPVLRRGEKGHTQR